MNTFLFGNAKSKAEVIARIAIMAALTILVQYLTGLAGIQLLTGSFVNLFLLLTALLTGLVGGVVVGIITPFIGLLLGLAPTLAVVPFIALSNAAYTVLFCLICKVLGYSSQKTAWKRIVTLVIGVVVGAVVKFFLMLFFAQVLFPLFLGEKLVTALSKAWGVLQLFTALIGGAVAIVLSIPLKKLHLMPVETDFEDGESAND